MTLGDHRIGFVGAGNMGEALIRGLLASGALDATRISVFEKDPSRAESVLRAHGIRLAAAGAEVAALADVLVLAVKPQAMEGALAEVRGSLTPSHLVVSIAAGLPTAWIEERLVAGARVVRVMPNTPALVGEAMSVACPGAKASGEDLALVLEIFGSVGHARSIDDEGLMDAVTGLSGSGPAFVFVFLEALSDGGVGMGLPRELANTLATQTVAGAARLARKTGMHFGELKDRVASPGGTTIAGLQSLEEGGLRAAVIRAVEAATRRSKELGR